MALFRVMVTIPHTSGAIAEQCVNNWAFLAMGDAASLEAVTTPQLKLFYDSWSAYRSVAMNWAQARSKGYDMSEPAPRAPSWDTALGLSGATGTSGLPSEVALCLSFQRLRVSGANMRRGRGRVYLGPFASVAHDGSAGRPAATFKTAVRNGAQALLDHSNVTPSYEWVVMTTVAGPATSIPVHDGWIDDAWDTQRRRGLPPTSRVVFTPAA